MYPWHMRTNVLTRGVSVLLAASACALGCGSTVDPASGPDGGGGGADGATDAADAADGDAAADAADDVDATDAPADAADGPAALCTSTGGTVSTATCCQATGDFPDLCSVGACGCPPQSSHSVAVCACAGGCFDPAVGCRVP